MRYYSNYSTVNSRHTKFCNATPSKLSPLSLLLKTPFLNSLYCAKVLRSLEDTSPTPDALSFFLLPSHSKKVFFSKVEKRAAQACMQLRTYCTVCVRAQERRKTSTEKVPKRFQVHGLVAIILYKSDNTVIAINCAANSNRFY